MVQRGSRTFGVDAAGGEHDVGLLAGSKALRAGFRVGEGAAGAGDVVNPGLQRGVDVEVDEAGADDQRVGCQQLVNERVGNLDQFLLLGRAGIGRGADGGGEGAVDMRQVVGGEVALDERLARVVGLDLLGQFGGDLGGERVRTRAGGQKQNGGHIRFPFQ